MNRFSEMPKPCETTDEIRQEILRLRRYDPLVRSVMDLADYGGYSGEDRYAILAYEALKQLATLRDSVGEQLMLAPPRPAIIKEEAK